MTDVPGLFFVDAPPAPETFNVIAYGQPGSGKSTFAATAPGPILWLNVEGPGALAYARKTATARGTDILEVRYERGMDVSAMLDQIYRHVHDGTDPKPATVVVDTLGKLREALIEQMVQPGSSKSLQQFGQVANKIGGFVRAMRDEPVNLVLLAHADVQDSDEGERLVRPLIGGKLTETLPAEVDVMAYTAATRDEDGNVRYLGQLVEGRGRVAKDRSGGLGAVRDLDLSDWLAAYRAALAPDDSDLPFDLTPGGAETAADATGDTDAGEDPEAQQTLADAA